MDTGRKEAGVAGYLNGEALDAVPDAIFQQRRPYPWCDVPNILTPEGYERLRTSLPDVSLFDEHRGLGRAYGQGYHDRYLLHYQPDLPISPAWQEFIAELQGPTYDRFIRRMFGVRRRRLILTLEWYYGWEGCAVSPHCDARRKLGTHIFYFNTEEDWQSNWGGHILIMDDQERYKTHSAPAFDDLQVAASIDPRGNGSLLFQRTAHSWHGVRPLGCPPNHLRKLFTVTINYCNWQVLLRRLRGKDPDGRRIVKKAS
jgi:hypothetical protein